MAFGKYFSLLKSTSNYSILPDIQKQGFAIQDRTWFWVLDERRTGIPMKWVWILVGGLTYLVYHQYTLRRKDIQRVSNLGSNLTIYFRDPELLTEEHLGDGMTPEQFLLWLDQRDWTMQ